MKELILSVDLKTFINCGDIYSGFKFCANGFCEDRANIKIITLSIDRGFLNINTFCEKEQCIRNYFEKIYSEDPVFIKIKCNSYNDIFNKTDEILKYIDKLNKIELIR